ncbi:MAG: serine/threonine-protein kinase [Armatimonadetes bacterium]|nr:serine/threonine-protein kinase [Armatimonadota bacterium]
MQLSWVQSLFPDLSSITHIGTGGQKYVFSASHPTEGRIVLKLIPPLPTDIATQRNQRQIDREILAVDTVQSLRVPRILDSGKAMSLQGEYFWIREQFIDGESLRSRLQRGPLVPQELLKIALQLLEALSDSERVNIVHRDVKPENIMIDSSGDFWLLDFGIARHLTMPSLTATAEAGKFTYGYAPSEQFNNIRNEIDSRADLFALGVTLHECWTGIQPFWDGARDHMEVLRRVENMPLQPFLIPCKDQTGFKDLVDVMTKKRGDLRIRTVSEALAWMQSIVAAERS